ncbi:MAG: TAT-variant-translocated molybdopterin oxidoreductase [Lentisphaeraceae bacterium]|nr:TAT-variant-translocated molybdopterin oxidoreductase [Lentisphaeraceae bacterium]
MSSLNNNTTNGKTYWRSLEELQGKPEFEQSVYNEFPEGNFELSDAPTRRGFMKAMAASVALAGGLTSCRRPEEKIMPYVDAPEDTVPGKAVFYATSAPRSRGAIGLTVKSFEGRPTKIEGLPGHPANNGSTDSAAQADLLDLYNPYRQNIVNFAGVDAPDYSEGMTADYRAASQKAMKEAKSQIAAISKKYQATKGAGLCFLGAPVSSPTQQKVQAAAAKALPEAKWFNWEAINNDSSVAALNAYLGVNNCDSQVLYDLEKAATILTLDSDFMMNEFNSLQMLQGYGESRRVYRDSAKNGSKYEKEMTNRFYAVEGAFTLTGSNADHRLRLQSAKIVDFAFALATKIAKGAKLNAEVVKTIEAFSSKETFGRLNKDVKGDKFLDEVAKELLANVKAGKKSAIIVGERQPKEVHLLALVLNAALGNFGSTVNITERVAKADKLQKDSISELTTAMFNGEIETLVIVDNNPVYDAPSNLKFGEAITKVKSEVINLTLFPTETSVVSSIVIPKTHYLESWGDTRSADGTLSMIQPLIAPLYSSMSEIELIAAVAGLKISKGYQLVKATHAFAKDKKSWEKTVQQGFIADSAFSVKTVSPKNSEIAKVLKSAQAGKGGFEIIFASDYSTFDGRYCNNGWMQELPDPITKLTWDNAALIGFGTATKLGIEIRDNITIKTAAGTVEAPAWIVPGMADDTVVLTLGYGREELGEKSEREYVEFAGRGFNSYALRTDETLGFGSCEVAKGNGKGDLVTTQDHWAMEGRDLAKEAQLEEFNDDFVGTVAADIADKENPRAPKMFSDRQEFVDAKYQWAMTIDLNSCVGCSACTIACQAENNIPVVGKERVREGREMHWIRMDRYFFSGKDSEVTSEYDANEAKGREDLHDLEVSAVHQPIPCMQCEEAPCEEVCPVAATQHSPEGLNDMVYNRCIGTRYCLNNCPFKVRRYNYFNFQEDFKQKKFEVKKMVFNPNVTVRSRGVMEKCTYCVQRINEAKIDVKVSKDETIIDTLTTACAQVCPTNAITFGDKSNEKSKVSKMREESRNYTLLPQLNVRPRTSFLAKLNNENKTLVSNASAEGAHGHNPKSEGAH